MKNASVFNPEGCYVGLVKCMLDGLWLAEGGHRRRGYRLLCILGQPEPAERDLVPQTD